MEAKADEQATNKKGASMIRVQSSLDLLCQTAGALEDSEGRGLAADLKVLAEQTARVSPSNLNGTKGIVGLGVPAIHSPLVDRSVFANGTRSISNHYLVGVSPSYESCLTLEDEDSALHGRACQHGSQQGDNHFSYMDGLRQFTQTLPSSSSSRSIPLLPRSSPFQPPASSTITSKLMTSEDVASMEIMTSQGKDPAVASQSLALPAGNMGPDSMGNHPIIQALLDQNIQLRSQLTAKDAYINILVNKIDELETKVNSLQSLPVGKISQISVDDLLELMHEYGSEVSDHALPPRREVVQKASVVRQFRRWNPNFFEYFEHRHGRWVPKLGKKAELARRQRSRGAVKSGSSNPVISSTVVGHSKRSLTVKKFSNR